MHSGGIPKSIFSHCGGSAIVEKEHRSRWNPDNIKTPDHSGL